MIPPKKPWATKQSVIAFSSINIRREGRVVQASLRVYNDSPVSPFDYRENGIVSGLLQYFVHATLAKFFKRNISETPTFSLKMTDLSTTRDGFEIDFGISFMFAEKECRAFLGQQTLRLLAFEQNTVFYSMAEKFEQHLACFKQLLLKDFTTPNFERKSERRMAHTYENHAYDDDLFPENAIENFKFFEFDKFFDFKDGYSSYIVLLSEIYRWHAEMI